MRTARSLTVSPSMLCVGGCTWSRGVYLVWSGGYLVQGVYLVGGCTWCPWFGGVPGPGGVPGGVPGPRGYLVLRGVYLVLGDVPGPEGVYMVLGVPGPGGCTCSRGVPGLGGVPGPGGSAPGPGGCQVLLPVNRMTDACKNITLPQLR